MWTVDFSLQDATDTAAASDIPSGFDADLMEFWAVSMAPLSRRLDLCVPG